MFRLEQVCESGSCPLRLHKSSWVTGPPWRRLRSHIVVAMLGQSPRSDSAKKPIYMTIVPCMKVTGFLLRCFQWALVCLGVKTHQSIVACIYALH